MGWKFFVDSKPWLGDVDLYVTHTRWDRKGFILAPADLKAVDGYVEKGKDEPFLGQTKPQQEDGLGDVDGFLQAALEAAWERGMRPASFKDHTNELTAVRYHLEDMRTLAIIRAPIV